MRNTTDQRRDHAWESPSVPAERYEEDLVPLFFERWAQDLVARAAPLPGERVLDLACGTGIVARIAAPLVAPGAVVGVDVNADMLSVARRVTASVEPRIEWRQANAVATGLPDEAFDVAFCQQGLQFFPDPAPVVRELHRLLVPGGRLAVSVWTGEGKPGYAPIESALERHLPRHPEAASFVRTIFALSDNNDLGGLLREVGFRDVRVIRRSDTVRCPSAAAWVETFLGAAPIPQLATLESRLWEQIVSEAAEELRCYVGEDGLRFPLEANIATARK